MKISGKFLLIKIEETFKKFDNVILTGDLKLLNEVYGLMGSTAKHPCIYCTTTLQELKAGYPRTLGSLKEDYLNWKKNSSKQDKCKDFNNVKNLSLFQTLTNNIPILDLSPPPTYIHRNFQSHLEINGSIFCIIA